jgi:hypothetical protein
LSNAVIASVVIALYLSSPPLSCAAEHTFWALEWMQMRAFAQRMRNLPPAATSLTEAMIFEGLQYYRTTMAMSPEVFA